MRRLVLRTFVFAIPFVLWSALVVVVDPFGYFNLFQVVSVEVKQDNAKQLNSLLYNSLAFRANPAANVLIGDSRTARIPVDYLTERTGERYAALTSNAAKLNEIVDLYWFAVETHPIRRVFIGLNFNMYNQYSYADRVRAVRMLGDNPLLYIFNRDVAEAVFVVLAAAIKGERVVSSAPPMTPDEFWEWNVRVKATHHYGKYAYPEATHARLREMAEHARANGIELTFLIVPHHTEFQARVEDFGLKAEEARFRRDLIELAPVIDLDFPNELTSNRSNFGDPIHMSAETARLLVDEIWRGPLVHGRRL